MNARFRCGDTILYRELDEKGRICDIKPVTVVEDSDARISLWPPLGSLTKKPEVPHDILAKPRDWLNRSWTLARPQMRADRDDLSMYGQR